MDALTRLLVVVAEPGLKPYFVQSRVMKWMMQSSILGDKAGQPKVKGRQGWFDDAVQVSPQKRSRQVRRFSPVVLLDF